MAAPIRAACQAHGTSFAAGNGVRITPDATLAASHGAEVVCMPELLVLADTFTP